MRRVVVVFPFVPDTTMLPCWSEPVISRSASGAMRGTRWPAMTVPPPRPSRRLSTAAARPAMSAALLGVVRPVAKRHLQTSFAMRTGAAALVGTRGVVVERVDADGGLVKLGGELWTARPYDGLQVIDIGRPVDVIEIQGATALVFPAEAL